MEKSLVSYSSRSKIEKEVLIREESIKLEETKTLDVRAFGYFIFHRLSLSKRSLDLISISLDGGERERHGSILGEITAIAVKTRTFVPLCPLISLSRSCLSSFLRERLLRMTTPRNKGGRRGIESFDSRANTSFGGVTVFT